MNQFVPIPNTWGMVPKLKPYVMRNPVSPSSIRIALCGASGSGKTTLAKSLARVFGIPFKENSAGLLLTPEQQEYLVNTYGWTKSGHQDVIRLSNINPSFGFDFQNELLITRGKWIANNSPFIIDRSPVDNITYFLLQVSALVSEPHCDSFIRAAQDAMLPITHLIYIPTMNPNVENNGSRVSNYYYQQMVTAQFRNTINTYFNPNSANCRFYFHAVTTWDWDARLRQAIAFIKATTT